MLLLHSLHRLEHVTLTRDLRVPAERAAFFARVRRGEVVALFRGVYVSAEHWVALDRHERYRTIVAAAAAASRDPGALFSHASAAALWRLPWLGSWPIRAHITVAAATGGRSKAMLARHAVGVTDGVVIDGISVTSLARTVADVARLDSFIGAVVVADAALRRTAHPVAGVPRASLTKLDLLDELEGVAVRQGTAKARRVIEFADGSADRPGESVSRVTIHRLGLPPPTLQAELGGASGRVYFADFWWPQFGLIGEFDGKYKYTDPAFLRGRTPEQALLDEKAREDDLRSAGHLVCRWGWETALSTRLLGEKLRRAGLV